jgi:hypothetical protein
MKKSICQCGAMSFLSLLVAWFALCHAQVPAGNDVPVTPDNFNRAESDMYFASTLKLAGSLGKFHHNRELMSIDKQTVIRANRDTLYSGAVFDLDAGPATITMPDAGKRFMSMMVINEDQYAPMVFCGAGSHNLTKDAASQKKVREALLALAATLPDTKRMFGPKNEVDPIRHLVGTATGWGGNAEKDAIYLTVVPSKNDGKTTYRLTANDVPVDGFWSISVYGADGYFQKNDYDSYSLNNITAVKGADGSVTIQFGGCEGKIPNCIPTTSDWNYWVRLYRPRPETLNGSWKFPDAQPVR